MSLDRTGRAQYTEFRCGKCSHGWWMVYPAPMHALAFTSLLRGIRCPECAGKRVLITEAQELPDHGESNFTTNIEIRGLWCIHCGTTFFDLGEKDEQKAIELFKIHDAECEKHPLMIRIRELEAQISGGAA